MDYEIACHELIVICKTDSEIQWLSRFSSTCMNIVHVEQVQILSI